MTKTELKKTAETYRDAAKHAKTVSDRNVNLRKARNYYEDAGMTGLAKWCEKHMNSNPATWLF